MDLAKDPLEEEAPEERPMGQVLTASWVVEMPLHGTQQVAVAFIGHVRPSLTGRRLNYLTDLAHLANQRSTDPRISIG